MILLKKTKYDELVKNVNAIHSTGTSNSVKKTDWKKIIMIIVISILLNKLTSEHFTTRLVQAILASKNAIAAFVKKTNIDDKLKILSKNISTFCSNA